MPLPTPKFSAGQVWDGVTSRSRPTTDIFKHADGEIAGRLSSEIIALEALLKNVFDAIDIIGTPSTGNSVLGVKGDASGLEYKDLVEGAGINITHATSNITITATSTTDEKVGIDAGATAGYIGAAANDGVIRVDAPLTYVDGGDFVTLGLNQAAVDHGALDGLTDDDHVAYSLADGTRAFTGTVGGIDPVASTDLATKEYVDQSVSFISEYYLTNTASGIGGIYYDAIELHTGEAEANFTVAGLTDGNGQPIVTFATIAGTPGMDAFRHGVYAMHVHVEKIAGTKPTKLYYEVYRREVGGAETLIATSELSDYITAKTGILLHASVLNDITVLVADRLVWKVLANVESTGSNASIVIYVEGDNVSRVSVPTSTEILSSIFLRQDGTKELTGNMIVTGGVTIDGHDLSVDGTKLDGVESLADVTDATNVGAAGAAMSGGAFHDGFSDSVVNEHIDWTGASENFSTSGTVSGINVTSGADPGHTHSGGATIAGTAGEILSEGDVLYVQNDGESYKAKADADATSIVIGLCDRDAAENAAIAIIPIGSLDVVGWGLTTANQYYLSSSTAGEVTDTAPSTPGEYVVPVGVAVSTTEMAINIQLRVSL